MKVFISHKQEDSEIATTVLRQFQTLKVACYLDLLDNSISGSGKMLTEHIKTKLNDCTDIIVVMSRNTRQSQWVPFEVGMAAQNDMPTATYLYGNVDLPDFLDYWPRLSQPEDIKKYVETKQAVLNESENFRAFESFNRYDGRISPEGIDVFYRRLKEKLYE